MSAFNDGLRHILILGKGQSNLQGPSKTIAGGGVAQNDRAVSASTRETDPFPLCTNPNQGGSMWPYLIDFGMNRGVRFHIVNAAIGGASVFQYTGRAGATITNATVPASVGYFSGGEMSGGTTVLNEGDAGFDPFNLNARGRAYVQLLLGKFDAFISLWENGESDAGASAADYQAGIVSVGNHDFTTGVDAFFAGLSSKPWATAASQYNTLEAGRAAAVAQLRAQGKRAFDGASMWGLWGENAPLYPELGTGSRVHRTLRGQLLAAKLWDDVLAAAGY